MAWHQLARSLVSTYGKRLRRSDTSLTHASAPLWDVGQPPAQILPPSQRQGRREGAHECAHGQSDERSR